jgi:hypothetical protein
VEKHYAIFKQKKMRKIYGTRYMSHYESSHRGMLALGSGENELIEDVLVWKGEIPNPKLTPGEQIYIEEISTVVTVGSAVRTTSDKMFYYLHKVELVEDELSIKSKEKALREIEEHNKKIERQNIEQHKKWYQFWK